MRKLLAVALLLPLAGCGSKDADLAARILERTSRKFNDAVGDAPLRAAGAVRGTIADAGVASRVQLRLRWEKSLEGADLLVENPEPGTILLRGTVPTAAAKSKAAEVARATVGVEKVDDQTAVSDGK